MNDRERAERDDRGEIQAGNQQHPKRRRADGLGMPVRFVLGLLGDGEDGIERPVAQRRPVAAGDGGSARAIETAHDGVNLELRLGGDGTRGLDHSAQVHRHARSR